MCIGFAVDGMPNVAAIGGARLQPAAISHLTRAGVDSVVLAFDNDAAGRDGISRAVEAFSRAQEAPAMRVVEPTDSGIEGSRRVCAEAGDRQFPRAVEHAECGVTWRAIELTGQVNVHDVPNSRRAALARAGEWLGTLPARLSLEQEDAFRIVADSCGYSAPAVERFFPGSLRIEPARKAHTRDRGVAIER